MQDSNTTPSRNFRPAFLSFQGFIDDAAVARFERALDAVEATSCTYLYLALSSTGGIGRCAARVAARLGPNQRNTTLHNVGGVAAFAVPLFARVGRRLCAPEAAFSLGPFRPGGALSGELAALQSEHARYQQILGLAFPRMPAAVIARCATEDFSFDGEQALAWDVVDAVKPVPTHVAFIPV